MTNPLEKNMIEAYNEQASNRDSIKTQEWKENERKTFLNYLEQANSRRLLEVGAGPGKDSLYFKEQGLHTFSTDVSPEMVKLCKEKGLEAAVMSFYDLKFPDEHFDSVYALNCLLHVPKTDIENVLLEIKRVLKPEGLFYLGVYGGENHEGVWEEDPYTPKRFFSFYEDGALKDLLAKYFKIEYFEVVPKEIVGGKFHFQSVILRKE